jgi:single-stranded DNA-binding protein
MNNFTISGRLAADVEARQNGEYITASFTLFVDSPVKKASYPLRVSCIGKNAEFIGTYGKKGNIFDIVGFISTADKEVDGKKITTMYLEASSVRFGMGNRKEEGSVDTDAPVAQTTATPKATPAEAPKTAAKATTKTTTKATAAAPKASTPQPDYTPPEQFPILEEGDALPF